MSALPIRRPGEPDPISRQAAKWVLRQEEGALSEGEERAFAQWLNEDRRHAAAYEDAVWALDAVARHAGEPETLALRSAALAAGSRQRRRFWGWSAGLGLAAASVAALVVVNTLPVDGPRFGTATRVAQNMADPAQSVYRTAIGERSAVRLPDGSTATLDTDSQIRVAYGANERGVYLVKGQALFEVAHGKLAPFKVFAGNQRITAVGTVFNVRLDGNRVRVSMVEGMVKVQSVTPGAGDTTLPAKEMILSAGEGLVAEPRRPLLVQNIDAQQVASWKGGVLMFNDMPLAEAVAEINRYTTRPIAVADASVGRYRISGVFKTNDPGHFSHAMADVLPVEVSYARDGAPILRAKAQ